MTMPRPNDAWTGFAIQRPGSDDGIAHTGRHFLFEPECWEDLLPSETLGSTPRVLRAAIEARCAERGYSRLPWHQGRDPDHARNRCWWKDPFFELLQEGLAAYEEAIQRAVATRRDDLPMWVLDDDRWTGALAGGVLTVVLRDEDSWRPITAFRPKSVIRDPDRRRRRLEAEDQACRAIRRKVRALSARHRSVVSHSEDNGTRTPGNPMTKTFHAELEEVTVAVRDALRDGDVPDHLAGRFLLLTARAERRVRDLPPGDNSVETVRTAVELRNRQRGPLGASAVSALQPFAQLPSSGGDLVVAELEMMEHLRAMDEAALLVPFLPTGAARRLRAALEETVAMLSLEPQRFAPASTAALGFMEEEGIAPGDPAWKLWRLAARAEAAAGEPVESLGLDPAALLRKAWALGEAKRSVVREFIEERCREVLAGLEAVLGFARKRPVEMLTATEEQRPARSYAPALGPDAGLNIKAIGSDVVLFWEEAGAPRMLEAVLESGDTVPLERMEHLCDEECSAWRWPRDLDPGAVQGFQDSGQER